MSPRARPLSRSLAALLVGLAVLSWPLGAAGAARRVLVSSSAAGRAGRGGNRCWTEGFAAREPGRRAPLDLAPDLLMELVAAGLRGGLSVVDALSCAIARPVSRPTATPVGRRPLARARRAPRPVVGGTRPTAARRRAATVTRRRTSGSSWPGCGPGVPADQAWLDPPDELDRLARAMVLAELSGAPAAEVVARAARDARTRRAERVELGAARLGSGWCSRWGWPCCRVSCCSRSRRSCSVWRRRCSRPSG